jgi:hypothetical protein
VARIVAVGVPVCHLVAAIVLGGSAAVNFFQQATLGRCHRTATRSRAN